MLLFNSYSSKTALPVFVFGSMIESSDKNVVTQALYLRLLTVLLKRHHHYNSCKLRIRHVPKATSDLAYLLGLIK